ncbi:MAG: hypothetical protein ACE5G1_08910 [bacterium]
MSDFESIKPQLNRIQFRALIVGIVALTLCGFGAYTNKEQFFQSYLVGYLFWIGLALGSLAIMSLHHLVGGGWGFAIQRLLESASRTLPVLAVLLVPLFFGMQELYVWARPEAVAADTVLQHKGAYLNINFFWLRSAAYFAIWFVLVFFINKWSFEQDKSQDTSFTERIQKISGPAILLYILTMTFASIDWAMSLDPHWFSTIYGFMFVIGQALLTLAFAVIMIGRLSTVKPLSDVLKKQHFHDLGNLMLAFVSLWAYMSLSQFLIIWSGNLPEEIPWYLHRLHGGWQWLALFVVVFHFALPLIVLLSRRTKRNITVLSSVAVAMVFMRLVDLFWIIAPSFHPDGFSFHWLDIAAPIGIGGLWVATFLWQLKGRALLPVNDPRLKEAFAKHH